MVNCIECLTLIHSTFPFKSADKSWWSSLKFLLPPCCFLFLLFLLFCFCDLFLDLFFNSNTPRDMCLPWTSFSLRYFNSLFTIFFSYIKPCKNIIKQFRILFSLYQITSLWVKEGVEVSFDAFIQFLWRCYLYKIREESNTLSVTNCTRLKLISFINNPCHVFLRGEGHNFFGPYKREGYSFFLQEIGEGQKKIHLGKNIVPALPPSNKWRVPYMYTSVEVCGV